MKKIFLSLLLIASSVFSKEIKVNITNILNKNGTIYIGLFKEAEYFTVTGKEYKGISLNIDSNTLSYTFKDLDDGTYAIAVIHDENKNKELDKNFLGIPSEGYGFSNNIRPIFRAATFEESIISLKSYTELTIKLGY